MAPDDPLDSLDDHALFEAAVGPLRRIDVEPAVERPRRAPLPRQRQADEAAALATSQRDPFAAGEPGDSSRYRRPEVAERILTRLRRGSYTVEDEFDLHGLTAADAASALRDFLADCKQASRRCLRVIHGKGLRAPDQQATLRPLVEHWLRQRRDVLAFCSAPPRQGGSGALLVLLDARRPLEGLNRRTDDDRSPAAG